MAAPEDTEVYDEDHDRLYLKEYDLDEFVFDAEGGP